LWRCGEVREEFAVKITNKSMLVKKDEEMS
jgi:hypothetical protein